ncbi:MAG TPA: hypothetical protein VHK24_02890 [Steroidobacter sp.]|nr:hypothetical protein [Steroidobacter sp.]
MTAILVATALGAFSHAATAQEETIPDHPVMRDRFFIGVGGMWSDSNVSANLNSGTVGLGAIIDFEEDLGLDETNLIALFFFRMNLSERWRLEAEYFKLDRDKETQIPRTIDWGDLNVPVNAFVNSTFNLEDIRVSVGYAFFKRKDKEIGVGLGAHVMDIEAALETRNFGSQGAQESAPLPVLTLYARMALTDRWLLNVRVDRLSLDTGDVDGSIFSSATEFIYQPWRHFSVGIGYRDINVEISSTSEDWRGKAQIRQSGPALFLSTTF